MTIDEAKQLLSEKIEYMDNLTDLSNLKYLIFKPIANLDDNDEYISLNYTFHNIKCKPIEILNNIINILTYTEKKIFNDKSKNLTEYRLDNLKTDIDYIDDISDYKDDDNKINDSNKYKIYHFIQSTLNIPMEGYEKSKLSQYKYTMMSYSADNNRIIIINKHAPIVKFKNRNKNAPLCIYEIEYEESELSVKQIEKDIFKQPIYPTIIIIDETCFLITDNAEQLFGFTEYSLHVSKKFITKLQSKNIFCEDNCLNDIIEKKKYYSQLSLISETTIERLNISEHRQPIIDSGLIIENEKIIIRSKNDIVKLLDLLNGRIEYQNPISGEIMKVRSSRPVKRE